MRLTRKSAGTAAERCGQQGRPPSLIAWWRAAEGRKWTEVRRFRCGRDPTSTRQAMWCGLAVAERTLPVDRSSTAQDRLTALILLPFILSNENGWSVPQTTCGALNHLESAAPTGQLRWNGVTKSGTMSVPSAETAGGAETLLHAAHSPGLGRPSASSPDPGLRLPLQGPDTLPAAS